LTGPGTDRRPALVSAIIPSYNYGRYLAEAIDSVLSQTYPGIEVIVVDDQSTDDSVEIARGYGDRVRLVQVAHGGVSMARNTGVAVARGEYLAFLDADDVWVETKLARQVSALQADDALDIVFGHVQQFYSPDLDADTRGRIVCPPEPQRGFHAGAMLLRAPTFARVGPFEARWRAGEFIEWYSRAETLGLRTLMQSEVVMRRRLHAVNQTRRERDSLNDYPQILKARLDRRRGRPGGEGTT
jgi:glycosyltransferase involved in cell wall biosynthesis